MKRIICTLLIITTIFTGCGEKSKNDKEIQSSQKMENKFEKNEENNKDIAKESTGQIAFGYLDENTDVYEYDGNDIKIPFYLENQGNKSEDNANVGLLLLVDGNVQDYRIEENAETKTMQKIVLKPKERKEFKLIFKPVSGRKGEKVGVIPVTIWNPDSLPKENTPIWGNNQQLGANIPLEIDMKYDGRNQLKATDENVVVSDIPEEILEGYKNTYVNDVYDALDESVNFVMETSEKDKPILYGKDSEVQVTLKLFGGKNVNEKITVFINNKPIKIAGKDYVDVKTEKGKMITVTLNLDLTEYERMNSIYAIVMTSGKDYKKQDVYKTDSLLLINDEKEKETIKETMSNNNEVLRLSIEKKEINLKNLINDKIIKKYELSKKQCANSIIEFNDGYCVRIYEANRELRDQIVDGFTVYDTPDESEIVNVFMKFFDRELRETATIDISKLAKEKKCKDLLMTNFTVSKDGLKIAWDIDGSILCYNRETREYTEYKQIEKRNIETENIAFVGNDKLAFYGTQGEMEDDTCYGYLDLHQKKLFSFIENKYEAFSLYANERYVWLNDGENPKNGLSSGKFVMIDTVTEKNNVICLDNIESTKSIITEDGNYIIAISQIEDKGFRVRQYDVVDGTVLNEKKYKFPKEVHASDIISVNNGKKYGIILGTDKGDRLQEFDLK